MARILIVDDSTVQRMIFRKYLEKEEHDVIGESKSGQNVVELYKKLKPDIVILDIVMPDANGMAILDQIMTFDRNANVIMCSIAALQNIIIESIQIGAKGFLVKPVTREALLRSVNKVIQQPKMT